MEIGNVVRRNYKGFLSVNDCVLVINKSGRILYCSRSNDFFGVSSSNILTLDDIFDLPELIIEYADKKTFAVNINVYLKNQESCNMIMSRFNRTGFSWIDSYLGFTIVALKSYASASAKPKSNKLFQSVLILGLSALIVSGMSYGYVTLLNKVFATSAVMTCKK
jgi:hypothetical protein